MVVSLISVSKGKNSNWLIFQAYVGELDRNRKFNLEFCGTELHDTLGMTEKMHEKLREKIREDFGSAPYNIEEAKKELGEIKAYRI